MVVARATGVDRRPPRLRVLRRWEGVRGGKWERWEGWGWEVRGGRGGRWEVGGVGGGRW